MDIFTFFLIQKENLFFFTIVFCFLKANMTEDHSLKSILKDLTLEDLQNKGQGEVLEIKGETNVYDAVKVHLFIGIESMMIDAYWTPFLQCSSSEKGM